MNSGTLFLTLSAIIFVNLDVLEAGGQRPLTNITVIGTVFCDTCSNNSFSKKSFFLNGVKVLIECKFKPNGITEDEISITAERTTDRFGIYKLDIPPVEGFECVQGVEIKSFCHASLAGKSTSSICSVPGLRSSTGHAAVKSRDSKICFFNLNALNYRPSRIDVAHCGDDRRFGNRKNYYNSALFFWPPFFPFNFPWPNLPVLPFPFNILSCWWPYSQSSSSPDCSFPFAPFLPPLPPLSSLFPPSPPQPVCPPKDPRS